MKIEEIHIYTYHLPLLQPLRIGKTFITSRSGAIIHMKTNTNIHGFGEASPLPGLHQENLNDVEQKLCEIKLQFIGTKIQDMIDVVDNMQKKDKWFSCIQFAVESAILNISEQINLSDQKYMLPKPEKNKIFINSLAIGNASTILQIVEKSLAENYRSIKVKVGKKSLDEEINLVRTIREIIGDKITLRLDANRAWGFEEAVTFAKSVKDLAIEYIEEPLKESGKLVALYEKTDIPIALDESLIEIFPERFEAKNWINTLILKPAVIGSVRKTLHYIKLAKKSGQKIVISDTFHTGVGLSFMIRLASTINEPIPMGFDTYRWLEDDILVDRLPVEDGFYNLNTVMKLCRKVDFSKLIKVG